MKQSLSIKSGIFLAILSFLFSGCGEDTTPSESPGFDRAAFLATQADRQILPAFQALAEKAGALDAAIQAVPGIPDSSALVGWQRAWKQLLLSWQAASLYNFGPAGESGIRKSLQEELATFPVSEAKVAAILSSGQFNLNDFNRDARGIFTLEYLLFDTSSRVFPVLARMQNPRVMAFARALSQDIKNRAEAVFQAWQYGYRDTFVAGTQTDAGSSTALLYNEFVRSYEMAKNAKLGLPLGLRAGQIRSEPRLVEALYSGHSREALEAYLSAIFDVYLGNSDSGKGPAFGWKQYLENVEGGKELVASTETQMDAVRQAMNQIPVRPSLSAQVSQPEAMVRLHTELQKLTRFYKSDMSSLMGIAITYSSGDGD
jgi:predicted lipoprotein